MHNLYVSGIYCQSYQAHLLGSNLKNPLTSGWLFFELFDRDEAAGKLSSSRLHHHIQKSLQPEFVCSLGWTTKGADLKKTSQGLWKPWIWWRKLASLATKWRQVKLRGFSSVVVTLFFMPKNRPPGTSCHLQNKVQHKQLVSDLSNVQNPLWYFIIVIASWKGSNLMAYYNPFPGGIIPCT